MNVSPSLSSGHLTPGDSQQLQNYNDLNSLQSLKYGDTKSDARIDAVAKQFESMFISLLMKSMRSANEAFTKDNPLNSNQVKTYQDMYDSQLSVSLSSNRGIGLAEVIKRQLSAHQGVASNDSNSKNENGFSIENYARRNFGLNRDINEEQVREAVSKVEQVIATSTDNQGLAVVGVQSESSTAVPSPTEVDFSSPESYVSSLLPYAKKVEAETGIDARLMLAQSALETGWGQHQILKEDGAPSHNLFGIKAGNGWSGSATDITTTEYRSGVALKERAEFRVYDSYEQSFRDYADFLQSNARYSEALEHRADPVKFAYALQESGYATDPKYGNKIESILDRYWQSPDANLGQ